MKRQLIRSRLLKITIAFAMMIPAIWLSGCGRQQTETKQRIVHVAEYGNDEAGTGAWNAPYATISHAAQTAQPEKPGEMGQSEGKSKILVPPIPWGVSGRIAGYRSDCFETLDPAFYSAGCSFRDILLIFIS